MWIDANQELPNTPDIYTVKLDDDTQLNAYFYPDKIAWISSYGLQTSHWWSTHGTKQRLDNVTHWQKKNPGALSDSL